MHTFSHEHCGLSAHLSCLDIICIRQIIENYKRKNRDTHLTSNLEKPYDSVPVSEIWPATRRLNAPEKWINVIKLSRST